MFRVVIKFDWQSDLVGPPYATRGDAEWAVACWRNVNGSNGQDTGFSVQEEHGPHPPDDREAIAEGDHRYHRAPGVSDR